jgi:hypothetical protein
LITLPSPFPPTHYYSKTLIFDVLHYFRFLLYFGYLWPSYNVFLLFSNPINLFISSSVFKISSSSPLDSLLNSLPIIFIWSCLSIRLVSIAEIFFFYLYFFPDFNSIFLFLRLLMNFSSSVLYCSFKSFIMFLKFFAHFEILGQIFYLIFEYVLFS